MNSIKSKNWYRKKAQYRPISLNRDLFDDDAIDDYTNYETNKKDLEVPVPEQVEQIEQQEQQVPTVDMNNWEEYLVDSYGDEEIARLEQEQQNEDFEQQMLEPYETPEIAEDAPEFKNTIEALNWAIQNNKKIKLDYITRKGANISRDVEPHLIFRASNGNLILVTYDNTVGQIRAFIVDNILNYIVKDDQFKKRMKVLPNIKGNENMDINQSLQNVAKALNSRGLKTSASIVKDAIKTVKTAQYVGVQGYWIRNRRCWDNCYRQKRTSSPSKPVQEVWTQCWDEYLESINNPNSGWEKYAGKNVNKRNKEWDKRFYNTVSAKILKGMSIPVAVYDTLDKEAKKYENIVIKEASTLAELAVTLKESGKFNDLSNALAETANEIIKTSQFTGGVANFFDWFRTKRGRVAERLARIISRIDDIQWMLQDSPQFWTDQQISKPVNPQISPSKNPTTPASVPPVVTTDSKRKIKISEQMGDDIARDYHRFVSDAREEIGFLRKYVIKNPDLKPVIDPMVSSLSTFVSASDRIFQQNGSRFEKEAVGKALGVLLNNLAGVRQDLGSPTDQNDVDLAEQTSGTDIDQDSDVGQSQGGLGQWTPENKEVKDDNQQTPLERGPLTLDEIKTMSPEQLEAVVAQMVSNGQMTQPEVANIGTAFGNINTRLMQERKVDDAGQDFQGSRIIQPGDPSYKPPANLR